MGYGRGMQRYVRLVPASRSLELYDFTTTCALKESNQMWSSKTGVMTAGRKNRKVWRSVVSEPSLGLDTEVES